MIDQPRARAVVQPSDPGHGIRHLAIIMDGNGRWAAARGLPRGAGHRAGVEALRRTVRHVGELGIQVLTVYSFSAENWNRPAAEVADLLGLLKRFIREDLRALAEQNVRVRVIGRRDDLAPDLRALLLEAETRTADNTGLILVVAFNYGARQEIVAAAKHLAEEALAGRLAPDSIDGAMFEAALDTRGLPDPDLIVRTSGEQRLSNFLLWQGAYAELVFVPVPWPDFDRHHLESAIAEFTGRQRRFGGLGAPVQAVR